VNSESEDSAPSPGRQPRFVALSEVPRRLVGFTGA
jgi:hypothetical protein